MDKKKYWLELTIAVNEESEEVLTNFLFELGANGCYSEKNILHSYFSTELWTKNKLIQFKNYLGQLRKIGVKLAADEAIITKIPEQDWNSEWKKNYRPVTIADKIIIRPSWIKLDPDPEKVIIEIDPQMAFGTGAHETTQLILKLMLKYAGQPKTILDVGAGTGILSIAAVKIFDATTIAFDNDPVAVATARQNFINNKVEKKVELFCGEHVIIKNLMFDLILANINRSVIINLLDSLNNILAAQGTAIFSGILIEEKNLFYQALSHFPLEIKQETELGEWLGYVVQKRSS